MTEAEKQFYEKHLLGKFYDKSEEELIEEFHRKYLFNSPFISELKRVNISYLEHRVKLIKRSIIKGDTSSNITVEEVEREHWYIEQILNKARNKSVQNELDQLNQHLQ